MTTPRKLGTAALIVILIAGPSFAAAKVPTSAWHQYLYGPGHASLNVAATAITPGNAARLHRVWTFHPPGEPGRPPARLMGAPAVIGGTVYVASFSGTLWALDERTGRLRWSADVGHTPAGTCPGPSGPTASPVVAPDPSRGGRLTVYMSGGDGWLYALNADTGTRAWRTRVADPDRVPTGFLYMAPLVLNDDLYVGVASNCEPPEARGRLVELHRTTGRIAHVYRGVPAGATGSPIWTSPASNGRSVWVTTGNAELGSVQPSGDSFSFVRLAATDLRREDAWAVVPSLDGTDSDFGSSPTLFSAWPDGRRTQMVGACNKNGMYYALSAQHLSAGPVWARLVGTRRSGGPTCLGSAIWDAGRRQLVIPSNATTIAGVAYGGSLRAVKPGTGAYLWQRGLNPGPIEGSPSQDGAGVIAAATADATTGATNHLFLLRADDGRILKRFDLPSMEFAQPIFADRHLFAATLTGGLVAYASG